MLLGLPGAPKEDSGFSSAELVLGALVALPGKLQWAGEVEQLPVYPASPQTPMRSYAEVVTGSPPSHLQWARYVYVRRGGSGPFSRLRT